MHNKTGNRIKEALLKRNMTASELANNTKISKSMISEYIHNKYQPKQKNLYLIAKALKVNEAWLMGLDVPMEKEMILLSENKDILKLWVTSISNETKISTEKIFNLINNTAILGNVPITYEYFKNFVLQQYEIDQIGDDKQKFILSQLNLSSNSNKESSSKLHEMIFMMHSMSDEQISQLYELFKVVFKDVYKQYTSTRIDIDELTKEQDD